MNENAAAEKLKEESLWLLKRYSGGIAETGCALNSLPDAPEEGLDPMTVTPEVLNIAEKMKKEAEQKLKTNFTTFTPLYYIKKGEIDYCIRVRVDNGKIDVCGQYCAGSVMRVKAKHVTEDDDQTFF
ncbi:PREDICTED: uncharacterized protein LOC109585710 [Amphimedon queenslandica]|uniref:Cystatin domain-containing protein n=2 Tax=Amphimedon queenslandica TaxID=400682 RepID=A0AAN0JKU1_AMPQE|nr:PREDICTED: uncharacterized protein LOC109585710 [Amphimedon queenslandica]|eukprot:XP_019857396.1 PREDICTED: uncharacterized protein LOC109585710 [Amphimedon queenslandica]